MTRHAARAAGVRPGRPGMSKLRPDTRCNQLRRFKRDLNFVIRTIWSPAAAQLWRLPAIDFTAFSIKTGIGKFRRGGSHNSVLFCSSRNNRQLVMAYVLLAPRGAHTSAGGSYTRTQPAYKSHIATSKETVICFFYVSRSSFVVYFFYCSGSFLNKSRF